MIAFEISVNGETLYTIGADDPGSIHATVLWGRKRGSNQMELGLSAEGSNFGEIGVERLEWERRALSVGDEVTIRVVDTDNADAPARHIPPDPALNEERRRSYYEQLKAEYGD